MSDELATSTQVIVDQGKVLAKARQAEATVKWLQERIARDNDAWSWAMEQLAQRDWAIAEVD